MYLAIDCETEPFGPANMAPRLACVSYRKDDGSSGILNAEDGLDFIEKHLCASSKFIVANAAFDFTVFSANRPRLTKLIFDAYAQDRVYCVLIRQKLIDLAAGQYRRNGPYSLANLCRILLDEKLEKKDTPRLDYGRLIGTPVEQWPQAHIDYAIKDAVKHWECFEAQEKGLQERGLEDYLLDQYRQTRAGFCLNLISCWGLRTDPEGVKYLEDSCLEIIKKIRPRLLEAGILKHNEKKDTYTLKKAPAQERMLESHGRDWDKLYLTPKGKSLKDSGQAWRDTKYISVNKEACSYSPDPLLQEYAQYAQLSNLLGGHVKAMKEGLVLPIHTRYETILETGRTSSRGPNVQNIRNAPGARECFVPRDGMVFGAADYSSAELYTLAQTCLDIFQASVMADMLNSGMDLHTGFGARLAGVTYDEAKALLISKDKKARKEMKTWRQRAKAFNFGVPGGMGARGLVRYARQYGQEITEDQAREYLAEHKKTFVVVHQFLQWVRRNGDQQNNIFDVEHPVSFRRRGKATYCAAANSYFQGRAADGAKAAMFEILRRQYTVPKSHLYGTRTVNFVHDEFIIETRPETAHEAVTELARVMETEFNKFTKDVPVSAEPVLMDRWSKAAEPIYDGHGRLQVWKYERK